MRVNVHGYRVRVNTFYAQKGELLRFLFSADIFSAIMTLRNAIP